MNILVLLRPMLDPAGLIVNRRAQKVFVNRADYIFNPSDKDALEAALRLTASPEGEGHTVTAVALGAAPAADLLRQARALGAHRAVLVQDPALADADTHVLVTTLQRLLARLDGVDLIMTGAESPADDLSPVGARLAAALGCPGLAGARAVTVTGSTLRVVVAQADGYHQLEANLPVVVTVAAHSHKVRYAHGAAIANIYRDPNAIETLTAADLQLTEADLAPLVTRRGESFPPERQLGRRAEGDVAEMAQTIAKAIELI